jgi:VanZ family protein
MIRSGFSSSLRRPARLASLCLPLLLWLAVITLASTDIGSEAHTGPCFLRFLHLVFPHQTARVPADFPGLMWAVRKMAHILEYAVLGALASWTLGRAFPDYFRRFGDSRATGAAGDAGRRALRRIALAVLLFGGAVAISDELHQSFVRSRTASPRDVGFDLVGVFLGVLLTWLVWRRHHRRLAQARSGPDAAGPAAP